jgi:hypothetical protein
LPRALNNIVKKTLAKAGYTVLRSRGRYMQDGVATVHNDHFRRWPAFQDAYRRGVMASNGVDPEFEWRVHVALWAAATSLHVPGHFVECGVNAGFISSAIMQRLRWNTLGRRYYLIDTFNGPVLNQYSREEVQRGRLSIAEDAVARGAYVTDLERVRANYAEWPNAVVVQGVVPEVLSTLQLSQIAFLHIDMNCAYPERAALEFLWSSLSPGGMVLLDDYAYLGHNEQANAMDDAARGLGAEILSIPTGQGLIIK